MGHESLLDLTGTACRPCSAPEMPSHMRVPSCDPSFCFSKLVWLPRIITSCPKTAKAPRVATHAQLRAPSAVPASQRRAAGSSAAAARRRPADADPPRRRPAAAAAATPRGACARPPLVCKEPLSPLHSKPFVSVCLPVMKTMKTVGLLLMKDPPLSLLLEPRSLQSGDGIRCREH